jgi:hypothetical protein
MNSRKSIADARRGQRFTSFKRKDLSMNSEMSAGFMRRACRVRPRMRGDLSKMSYQSDA